MHPQQMLFFSYLVTLSKTGRGGACSGTVNTMELTLHSPFEPRFTLHATSYLEEREARVHIREDFLCTLQIQGLFGSLKTYFGCCSPGWP